MSSEPLLELLKEKSIIEKIKIHFLSKDKIADMQNELINNYQPAYRDYILIEKKETDSGSLFFLELFEERIKSLPNETLYDLNEYWRKYNTSKSENKKFYWDLLLNSTQWSYSINGWGREKLIESIKK